MNSKDITVTQPRARNAVEKQISKVVNPKITSAVKTAVEENKIRTGRVTKVYPYLDKFEVKLHNVNKRVLCKRLHLFGPDLLDLYTPLADRKEFDTKRKEPCIIPRYELSVLVLPIHDDDSNEYLLLGFYQNDELVGLNPAQPGNLKLASLSSETNQFWIKFGRDGLDLRLPKSTVTKIGALDKDMEDINYADSTKVYTKDECYNKTECYNKQEVYTKEEVDELIAEKVAEAIAELQGEDTNDTTS